MNHPYFFIAGTIALTLAVALGWHFSKNRNSASMCTVGLTLSAIVASVVSVTGGLWVAIIGAILWTFTQIYPHRTH